MANSKPVFFKLDKLRDDLIVFRLLKNRYSLRQAANLSGVPFSTISRVETGRGIDVENFAKLCGWMNKNPSDYFPQFTEPKKEQ